MKPSPILRGGEPSVPRRNSALRSRKSTCRPSSERSERRLSSVAESSRSRPVPGGEPRTPGCASKRAISNRPSGCDVEKTQLPRTPHDLPRFPERVTASNGGLLSRTCFDGVNQISRPSADHASPTALGNHPSERTLRGHRRRGWPPRHRGLPALAEGDPGAIPGNPHVADRPLGFEERLPDRVFQSAPFRRPARATASCLPSGDQSAAWTCSRTSRSRIPASRPALHECARLREESEKRASRTKGELIRSRDRQELARRQVEASRFGRCQPRREKTHRAAIPRRAVDDRLAVGSKATRTRRGPGETRPGPRSGCADFRNRGASSIPAPIAHHAQCDRDEKGAPAAGLPGDPPVSSAGDAGAAHLAEMIP